MTTTAVKSITETSERTPSSYDEYRRQASETRITEWVDEEMITYMPPLLRHQELSGFLFNLLSTFVAALNLGKIISAPFEVKLWPDGPSREPDLLFVSNDNLERLGEKRFDGGPDLVVEIVSAGSVREDKVRKFDEYEQAGVSEYWIIDPRQRQETAEFFQRDESGIYQPIEVDEVGVYQSYTLPGFWLNVDWLWMDPLPNHQLKLAEIVKDNTAVPEQLRQLYAGLYDFLSQS
jgi:Uma2 family endonuclease